MRGEAQNAPYPVDVLLLGAQAVMPDSQRLAQHIEQVWYGSPTRHVYMQALVTTMACKTKINTNIMAGCVHRQTKIDT
jgi:hypothetical protein